MHRHVRVCSPFHLADASSFHYSCLRVSLFLLQPMLHPSSILLSLFFLLAFTFTQLTQHTIPAAHSVSIYLPSQSGFLEIVSNAHGLPPHTQQLPPTFLRRAQQALVFHNGRAAEVDFTISDSVLVTLGAAQSVSRCQCCSLCCGHSWAQEKRLSAPTMRV